MGSVTDCWGMNDNDLIVDAITPLLIQALALIDKIMEKDGNITMNSNAECDLSSACNIINAEESLIDALAACRQYQKGRLQDIAKQRRRENATECKKKESEAAV